VLRDVVGAAGSIVERERKTGENGKRDIVDIRAEQLAAADRAAIPAFQGILSVQAARPLSWVFDTM
jgi:hypothetical protein